MRIGRRERMQGFSANIARAATGAVRWNAVQGAGRETLR
ncbi:hypothetical protein M2427_008490 [Bradyrhizobium sp. BR13661]|nr:hypothetical protein [Bradyrhizobium sp. BR13661]